MLNSLSGKLIVSLNCRLEVSEVFAEFELEEVIMVAYSANANSVKAAPELVNRSSSVAAASGVTVPADGTKPEGSKGVHTPGIGKGRR